jgi:hypothetical protein
VAGTASRPQSLEHDPEKHALGLDPMGGYRFSVKIMLKLNNLGRDPIQLNWITVWPRTRMQSSAPTIRHLE